MREINYSADELVAALLDLETERGLCLLDSNGVSYLDSHLLIAGINPVETLEINEDSAEKTLEILNEKLSQSDLASMLTISYDFGLKLNKIKPRTKEISLSAEPDIFLTLFDVLIVHDYNLQKSFLIGNPEKFNEIEESLADSPKTLPDSNHAKSTITSNFTREKYLKSIEKIQELIRKGDTYQTNLTQQIRVELPEKLTAEKVFSNLRKNHPAPFAAFFRRQNDVVISQSPERFFTVQRATRNVQSEDALFDSKLQTPDSRLISVSPIKGTRPRGENVEEDEKLRNELLISEKDRAENVMIVDLLRNDIGRICEYGSVKVEKLCDLEKHPTLYHLVSTISGTLRENTNLSDILRATFPCGSITGAPKIRTMRIIDELETAQRGLSMGAIGYVKPMRNDKWSMINDKCSMDFNVAIRTMTIRGKQAVFNVGGGITIDSVLKDEYAETLVKAKSLLEAVNADDKFLKI